MKLDGKNVLITGGAERVGRLLSYELAKEGANLIINYFKCQKAARKLKDNIEKLGRKCLIVEADISDLTQVNKMFEKIERTFEKIDVLVNNASNFNKISFFEIDEQAWNYSIDVTLKGTFFVTQAAAKLMMKNNSGRIISIIGNSYYENWPDFMPHCIAKTGLGKMTQCLAIALSPKIQCNAICPCAFFDEKGTNTKIITSNRNEKIEGNINIVNNKKLYKGCALDVAELIIFLCNCSNYINGAIIPIDGGKRLA